MNENMIRDALYYLDPECNTPLEKQTGILIGLVSALCAVGWNGTKAIKYILGMLPLNYQTIAVPKAWWEFLPPGPLQKAISKLPSLMTHGGVYTRSMLLDQWKLSVSDFDLLVLSGYLRNSAVHPGWYEVSLGG